MIEKTGPKTVLLSMEDWTSQMMILASKLHRLPLPPGETGLKSHEVGIDRLNSLPNGPEAVEALFELVDDLNYCPSHHEVVWLGKVVIKANDELDVLLANRRRDGLAIEERRKKPAKITPPRTTGRIRFRRGN